jgi:hypothetical protein
LRVRIKNEGIVEIRNRGGKVLRECLVVLEGTTNNIDSCRFIPWNDRVDGAGIDECSVLHTNWVAIGRVIKKDNISIVDMIVSISNILNLIVVSWVERIVGRGSIYNQDDSVEEYLTIIDERVDLSNFIRVEERIRISHKETTSDSW